jgi:hypothetical protein
LDLRGRKWQEVREDCIMRSFIICKLHLIRVIKSRRMSLARDVAQMGKEKFIQNFGHKNLKGKDISEDLGVEGKIISKNDLKEIG